VALSEAVYSGNVEIENFHGKVVDDPSQALEVSDEGSIPVLIDPEGSTRFTIHPTALVDARMLKREPELGKDIAPFVVGLGPGFHAGDNCHAVVETNRGHYLGRVLWEGTVEEDTGIPERVVGYDEDRVLRAPRKGKVKARTELGSLVKGGEIIAEVAGAELVAPFGGALRGLIHESVEVSKWEKIGDLDPRSEVRYCFEISDKALAIGGGVLEALLSRSEIRGMLGS
jgi:xanthine dehydrogenase accessory factor